MWQRFTEMARKAVFYAQEEAQKFGEGYVSTEHLLLGLVRQEDNVACRALEKLGVSPNRVRVEVERQLPRGDARPSPDMTLTPRAKRVIDLAYDEARLLNNNYIGTEHLLLGLIRESDGLAGRVLTKLGVDLERTRAEVMAMQDDEAGREPRKPSNKPSPPGDDFTPFAWSAYDAEAQETMFRAQGVAAGMGETHLTPLHLALALLDDPESAAMRALTAAGVEPERLREEIDRHRTWAVGAPPDLLLSPNGRKAMDGATLEAQELSSDHLGSGHLLLGLVRGNPDGLGKILGRLGVSMTRLRKAVEDGDKGQEEKRDEE